MPGLSHPGYDKQKAAKEHIFGSLNTLFAL